MTTIQIRRDTSTSWGLENPVLGAGEMGVDLTTRRFKLGDGEHTWAELEWAAQFLYEKNQPGGYAGIDEETGKIDPEFIDFPEIPSDTHYQAFPSFAELPSPGQATQLYLALDTNYLWRWNGTGYSQVAGDIDASPTVKGVVKLTGDLGGTAELPKVAKINGVAMPTGTPEPGQVIKAVTSSTTAWANDNSGGGGGGGEDDRFKTFEQDIGDGTANPITVTHMMGTRQILASMTRKKGDCEVISIFRMKAPSPNYVIIEPDRILDTGSWRLTLFGSMGLSDVTAPEPPEVAVVASEIDKITAEADSEDPDVTGYNWFVRLSDDPNPPAYAGTTPNANEFQFTGLLGDTEYEVFATALDSSGNESALSDGALHTTPVPVPFAYTSFPTLPAGIDVPMVVGAGPAALVNTDKIRETAGTDGNKSYYSLFVLPDNIHTPRFRARAVNAGIGGATNRGAGVGICNADGTRAVIAFAAGGGQGVAGRIQSWVNGILTSQATLGSVTWNGGNSLELVPSVDGSGVVTWTVWRNDVPTTLTWKDSGHLLDLPGTFACLAFGNVRSGGANYYSPGIASMSATPI